MAYEIEYSNFPSENITLHGFKNIDDASVTYTLDGKQVTTTIDKLIAQINQAIDQVSQVVQNNSATSEECAAASIELSNQATRMQELLRTYNLGDDAGDTFQDFTKEMDTYSGEEPYINLDEGFGKY